MRSGVQVLVRAVTVAVLASGCGSSPSPSSPSPTPPPAAALSLTCPAAVVASTAAAPVAVTYDTPAAAGGVAPVTVACTAPSGQPFPIGAHEIRCTATDSRGATAGCGFAVTVSRLPTLSRTRVLAFGDSVTVGIVATINPAGNPFFLLNEVPGDAYPTVLRRLLAERYSSQTLTVINGGKGGERAADAVGRAQGLINNERPDVVVLLQGYNDLAVGAAGIAPGIAGINEIVKIARFRGARVFVATLTPPGINGSRGLGISDVTAFNQRLRDVARGENAVLIDLYQAMAGQTALYNSDDGRHPSVAGYRKIAELVFAALRADLEAR